MKTEIRNASEVLNELLKINNDRVEGYQNAAEGTHKLDLKTVFEGMADESKKNASELIREIKKSGGDTVGKVCPVAMDEKTTFTGKDRQSMRDSCEYGKDAQSAYRDAISSNELTTVARQLVRNQQAAMKVSYDMMKNFRDGHGLPMLKHVN